MAITAYCSICKCETPDDIRKAGEMLISKMTRGVEKYCGNDMAVEVLNRTVLHTANPKGDAP